MATLSLLLFGACCPQQATGQSKSDEPTVRWTGTWATSPVGVPFKEGALAQPQTVYETVHLSRGGSVVRLVLTNEFGTDSLRLQGVHVSLQGADGQPVAGSDRMLLFHGQSEATIPAGAVMLSDPMALDVPALSDLRIRFSLPAQPLHVITAHTLGLQTNFQATGSSLPATPPSGAQTTTQWHFLKSVEVGDGPARAGQPGTIVALGDSITDGYRSTPDTNHRWPDLLAKRLQAEKHLRATGVLNEGISGNRVLHDGAGPNALARLDRDVLSQDDVRYLVVMEGINDIGHTAQPRNADDPITAQQLIAGLAQIVERAHAHGIRVYGATLTPFLGAGYASSGGETMRQTVNAWIRAKGNFDGVIDFDKITRDPAAPEHFAAAFDSGDHLHPNDAGYQAMANGIDLALFTENQPGR